MCDCKVSGFFLILEDVNKFCRDGFKSLRMSVNFVGVILINPEDVSKFCWGNSKLSANFVRVILIRPEDVNKFCWR